MRKSSALLIVFHAFAVFLAFRLDDSMTGTANFLLHSIFVVSHAIIFLLWPLLKRESDYDKEKPIKSILRKLAYLPSIFSYGFIVLSFIIFLSRNIGKWG